MRALFRWLFRVRRRQDDYRGRASGGEPESCSAAKLSFTIFFESIATSIDAFVVGVSLAAAGADIVMYGLSIGLTTLACCFAVLIIGRRLGERFGSHAQIAGGIVLIFIGLKAFFG